MLVTLPGTHSSRWFSKAGGYQVSLRHWGSTEGARASAQTGPLYAKGMTDGRAGVLQLGIFSPIIAFELASGSVIKYWHV